MAIIINDECTACGACLDGCPAGAIVEGEKFRVTDECTECLACVETCPANAMTFGDLDDPRSEVVRLSESPRAFRLMEELGTRPKVIFLSKGE